MAKKKQTKNKKVDWIICLIMSIFFGGFGADRFMMGQIGAGIIKLLTFGGFGIWWFIDIILIATKHEYNGVEWKEEDKKTKKSEKWNKFAIFSISSITLIFICFLLAMVDSLFGMLIPIFGILSIIFGFLSLNQIKKNGEKGKSLALISIILVFSGLIITAILISIGIAWTIINNFIEQEAVSVSQSGL